MAGAQAPAIDPSTDSVAGLARRAAAVELPVYSHLPFVPARGEGCHLFDTAGRRYLDMYGGHAVALTGHCHPHVVSAIQQQAARLLFYSNVVHLPVRVAASEKLLRHAQPGSRLFLVNSGAEVNEAALKLARKVTNRRVIVSFEGGFHGRSLATLSATGIPKYRATCGPVVVEHHRYVPFGDTAAAVAAIREDTAAVLCEPIQSLGGVHVASPDFYRALARQCAAAGAALIFDELQTGLGRCGHFFFGDGVGVQPDMISLAKGLASGVPCGALVVAPRWAESLKPGDQGTTFGGGPLAMAAMLATLEVIEREGLVENARTVGDLLAGRLRETAGVREVRGQGLLLGVELEKPAKAVQLALLERGVIVGDSSTANAIRLLPPLTLAAGQVDEFIATLGGVLRAEQSSAPG